MSYIVPIHRPSGVRLSIKLNFLSSQEQTLVVAKANRLEIYSFDVDGGLTLVHSRSVYGYIIMLEALRPTTSATDHLFVGTDRQQYFTCSWDTETNQVKTEQSYVDQADKTLRNARENDRVHIDPTRRFMTLEIHDGVVTVVPIVQQSNKKARRDSSGAAQGAPGSLGEPVQVRIEEIAIRSSAFVAADEDSKDNPQFAILWEDNSEEPQLKVRELKYSAGGEQPSAELETVSELRGASLDSGVSHLIPVPAPHRGFLVLSERSIGYVDASLSKIRTEPLDDQATIWSCWCKVDDFRWLLADEYGKLYFLMLLVNDGDSMASWRIDFLGQASKAACLVYMDAGVAFLGSHSGDSQLVVIKESGVEVLQTFPNIAPILDLKLMDLGRGGESAAQAGEFSSGQARLVTASGAWQDASIRSVRSGVGVEEIGDLGEVPLITDMWAVSSQGSGQQHDALVLSLVEETKVFKFDSEGGVEEVEDFHNLDLQSPTILAANLPDRKLLQVSETSVQISDMESGMSILQWKPTDGAARMISAAANGAHVLVVENGLTLHVFHSSGQATGPSTSKTFSADSQISSVTVPDSQSNICIVAFPQRAEVAILEIHSLETLFKLSIGAPGDDIPRSVLLASIMSDVSPTLFIAMADGTVITYALDLGRNVLTGMAKILLGTEPVFFKTLPRTTDTSSNLVNVFASCEQPSLIYASEGRIIYSAVNSEFAARVCAFDSEAFPNSLAIASDNELKLANIDTARTTQIQTLPINETVRCISYQPELKLFGMGCISRTMEIDEGQPFEHLTSSVKIADEVAFKEIDSFDLDEREMVECITTIGSDSLDEDDEPDTDSCMFVVGTSIAPDPEARDPEEKGRILVFSVEARRQRLKVIAQTKLKGPCRSLALADGMIVAGLLKVVTLYSLSPSLERGSEFSHKLTRQGTYRTSTEPLSISVQPARGTRPTTIAVGDLLKSLSVISIEKDPDGQWTITELARHFATLWTSSIAAVADFEWVIADVEGNLAMLRQNPDAYGEEARRLELTGDFRLGEIVNCIAPITTTGTAYTDPATTITTETDRKGKARTMSTTSALTRTGTRTSISSSTTPDLGPLIKPQAFLATVEGSIYMLGAINPSYTDALIRLQNGLASKVVSPGYMPWNKFRAWKTEVRESEEPFRFVDGEMVEQGLLRLGDEVLEGVLRETGLALPKSEGGIGATLEQLRWWGEELRRLY